MTPNLLNYLCEPVTKHPLQLVDAVTTADGTILSGALLSPTGKRYPIINGIPRFVDFVPTASVSRLAMSGTTLTSPILRSTGSSTRWKTPLGVRMPLKTN